jgi:hypothetical protein
MDSRAILSLIFKSPEHHPEVSGEALTVFIPRGVRDIILDYLHHDIKPMQNATDGKSVSRHYSEFKLLGRDLRYFMDFSPLENAAQSILSGNEKGIQEVLKLVKENPMLLHIPTKAFDARDRCIVGSLLQMAAMMGDFNLKPAIHHEEEMGLVERFKIAANLSDDIVNDELQVILGREAILENEKRNQLVLVGVDKLLKGIFGQKIQRNETFHHFHERCLPFAVDFNDKLEEITDKPIKLGYIFDPSIISQAAKKLESYIKRRKDWFSFHCAIFRVLGLGTLQKHLSIRDAQIVQLGMNNYIEKHQIPARNLDANFYYSSLLGLDHYLNAKGERETLEVLKKCKLIAPPHADEMRAFEKLVFNKNNSIKKFTGNETYKSIWKFLPHL